MVPDDSRPTGEQHGDRSAACRSGGRRSPGRTRRSLLRSGAAALAGTALAGAASSPGTATHAEAGLQAPTDLEVAWRDGADAGLRWNWDGHACPNRLSHFYVGLSTDDGFERVEVPSERTSVAVTLDAETEHEVSVRAVDHVGRASDAAEATVQPIEPATTVRPATVPELAGDGTATVPLELGGPLVADHDLERVELEVELRPPCVATLEDVALADGLGLDVEEASVAADGSSASLVATGEGAELASGPIATVTVAGRGEGAATLDVLDAHLEARSTTTSGTAPADADSDDLEVESPQEPLLAVEPVGRWAPVTVEEPDGPAPPENLRAGEWISQTIGLRWDWPGDACEALSHFRVTLEDGEGVEVRTVPATSRGVDWRPHPMEVDYPIVSVRAVDHEGRHSEPLYGEYPPDISDPAYTLSPRVDRTPPVGGTTEVRVQFAPVVGEDVDPIRAELGLELDAACVATIEDVRPGPEDWELQELDVADDGTAATFALEGPPPATDDHRRDLAVVEVAGQGPGETVVAARDRGITALEPDRSYDYYQYLLQLPEEERPEDVSTDDFVTDAPAEDTWTTVEVVDRPPTLLDEPPRDLNDDGLFRDVDGDGDLTQVDVVRFFEHQHRPVVDDYPTYYDFSGDGDVGHGDVVDLFEHVAT